MGGQVTIVLVWPDRAWRIDYIYAVASCRRGLTLKV
jgi:hypothetical protein